MVQFSLGGQVAVSPGMVSTPGSINGMATVVLTGVDALGAITDPSAMGLLNLSLQAGFPGGPLQFNQLAPAGGAFLFGPATDLLGPVAGSAFSIAANGVVFQLVNGLLAPIN